MTSPRLKRRRARRAMLARRRRFSIRRFGRFETAAEIRIIHKIPKG